MERHNGLGTDEATILCLAGIRHVHRPLLHHLQLHLLGQGPLSIPRPSYLHTHAHIPSGQRHQRTQSGFTASLWLHLLSGPAGDIHIYTYTHTYTLQCSFLKYIMQRALSNIYSLMTSASRKKEMHGSEMGLKALHLCLSQSLVHFFFYSFVLTLALQQIINNENNLQWILSLISMPLLCALRSSISDSTCSE